ncbi:MAG TPA: LPS assembly protein LptD [Syntrophales bacterium]|nr:LPS assembly protein LptD [Syntrophales bacterium]HOM06798.1 LPS assembly protein LptD [Syntrophales bacterium]HPQ06044.1 LPS assembly protein LptD [Syntrophales bacterium]
MKGLRWSLVLSLLLWAATGAWGAPETGPPTGEGKGASGTSTAVIKGRVTDMEGRPVAGVRVSDLADPHGAVVTDGDGFFSLAVPRDAAGVNLELSHEAYFPLYPRIFPPFGDEGAGPLPFLLTPLPAETGPGVGPPGREPVLIEADSLAYDWATEVYTARGAVHIRHAGSVLDADHVSLDRRADTAEAEGRVRYVRGGDAVEGEKVVLNITDGTGTVSRGRIFIAVTHFHIAGERIERRSQDTYFVLDPQLTTCDGDDPDWKLKGRDLRVTVDGYGLLRDGRFYVKDVPVLYTPYLPFPAKTRRQSGFLFPRLGYSRDRLGTDVTLPFFWAISEDLDATFYPRMMSSRGFQGGAEFRYALSEGTSGVVYGDFLNDTKEIREEVGNVRRDWHSPTKRWALYLNHEQRFDPTFYLRADIARVSDPFYFRDFSSANYFLDNYSQTRDRPFRRVSFQGDESLTSLDATVRLVKDWQRMNLTVLAKGTDDLTAASNEGTLQRYPEVTLTALRAPLFGTRIHGEGTATYDYFYRGEGQKGHYYDLNPALSLPLSLGAFQVTPRLGVRGTFWERDDKIEDGLKKRGDREVYSAGVTATTEAARVYSLGSKEMDKIRHAVRPEVTYTYSRTANQDESFPNYAAAVNDVNAVTYALVNTITARLPQKDGSRRYRELMRLKLAQTYDIKEAQRDDSAAGEKRRPFGDLALELDLNPFSYLSAAARNKYNVHDGAWTQANYDLSLKDERGDTASLTYRYTRDSVEETNVSLKAIVTKELTLAFAAKWDHLNHRDMEKVYSLTYRRQCWTVGFEFSDRETDRTFSLKLSLLGM